MRHNIDLRRTFRPAAADETGDEHELLRLFASDRQLTWHNLHQHEQRTVVVIGEAGVGKTVELALEVQRLKSAGQAAFFLELSLLETDDDWRRQVADQAYDSWQASEHVGHFFLDAVDEAKLISITALARALSVAQAALKPCLHRVRVVLSSRISDWALVAVRDLVQSRIADPIRRAVAQPDDGSRPAGNYGAPDEGSPGYEEPATMLVVRLENLSPAEARRYARHVGLTGEAAFWDAIEAGGFRFMAGRPLDLDWLVRRWNDRRRLGELLELLESNVELRLDEVNPSHRESERHLPRSQLRAGAERIAAAEVFGGLRSTSTEAFAGPRSVNAYEVLDDWRSASIDHLLGTALFDEATFGRVKFHHRTVREYLAACWVDKHLLATGVSLPSVMALFVAKPFHVPVLIPSRRWTLCWLAALNARVRERIAHHHPEMVVFDGDPMAWDEATADLAFRAFIRKLVEGYRPDWLNSAHELGRVGRRLPPGLVASMLVNRALGERARSQLMDIAFHAGLTDCAAALFEIYEDSASNERMSAVALQSLSELATADQRAAIADALLNGQLTGNARIAAGLRVAGLRRFSAHQLRAILLRTGDELPYGSGHMVRTIRDELVPSAGWQDLVRLLSAVLSARPVFAEGETVPRRSEQQPPRAWTLAVLPNLCAAALERAPVNLDDDNKAADTLLGALVELQRLRDSQYIERDEVTRIARLIEGRGGLRWALAERFFARREPEFSCTWMTMDHGRSLVVFHVSDLEQLAARSGDLTVGSTIRSRLFVLAQHMAWHIQAPHQRRVALRALIDGPDAVDRRASIIAELVKYRDHKRLLRTHQLQDEARDNAHTQFLAALRSSAMHDVPALKSGTDVTQLARLLLRTRYEPRPAARADAVLEAIQRDLGAEVAGAVCDGLRVLWNTIEVPNPRDRDDGRVPDMVPLLQHAWALARREGSAAGRFSVARAARLAAWSPERPRWFDGLVFAETSCVIASLKPWFVADAASVHDAPAGMDALEMALRADGRVRTTLLEPLKDMVLHQPFGRSATKRRAVRALHEAGLLTPDEVGSVITGELLRQDDGLSEDEATHWLCLWLHADIASAWTWMAANLETNRLSRPLARRCVHKVSNADRKTAPSAAAASAQTMVQMCQFLLAHREGSSGPATADPDDLTLADQSALEALARSLSEMPGSCAAQEGLRALASAVPAKRPWLMHLSERQAGLSAEINADMPYTELRRLEATFSSAPLEPGRLYLQVIARLEDLRVSIEDGPYSEAVLFTPGMDESQLQVWLAARIGSFGNRRFSVTREEELHRQKRSDVQVVCAGGKVCIEVKPLDDGRYTASQLVGTLRDQIVKQYLIGHNSRHGILLLIMLKRRRWMIPGRTGFGDLTDLVLYLQAQANQIAAQRGDIEKLTVFAIDASPP